MSVLLTIFTPVYNRADKLLELYQSLLSQTLQEFVWILVDDGSQDKTPEVIQKILEEQKLNIIAKRQQNQGKHVAHNKGVELCETKLFVCVDSDDTLIPTAVEEIIKFYQEHIKEMTANIAGIIAWKGFSKEKKIGTYPSELSPASLSDLYQLRNMTGDAMLIFFTSVIKKYPFPQFVGERFLRESIAYNQIDMNFKYLIFNQILYIADYYDDGLSKNASKLELKSPRGAAMFRWDEYMHSISVKAKIRNLIAYVFFNRLAKKNRESIKRLGCLFIPLWLASWGGFIHYREYLK